MMPAVVGVDRDRLRRLRLGKGWTQVQLAEKADVSADTIVRWERGRGQNPHPTALTRLSKALGVEPNDLLED